MDAHANFAYSTVATAPSPATSGTSLVVASGDGAKFPAVPFNATVWPAGSRPSSANAEIVRVTGISTDTLTITRTQESTSARSVLVGDQIVAAVTKKTLTDIEAGQPGTSLLVYRYTVVGSDKASIDTGADTADAGSNDWTDGDLLEVLATTRTDDAAAIAVMNVILNNDGGGNYDQQFARGNNATASAQALNAQTSWGFITHGSGGRAAVPGVMRLNIPDFAGVVFEKTCEASLGVPDSTAANEDLRLFTAGWRSTAAVTRLKIFPAGTAKFKVGSQLLIYKRKAS